MINPIGSPPPSPEIIEGSKIKLDNKEDNPKLIEDKTKPPARYTQDGLVALGNTRLSIVDVQNLFPVPIRTPNHSAVLTYNGELFNYQELRKNLEAKGEKFQTHSDTEVMLLGLQEEGVPFDILGNFAFVCSGRVNLESCIGYHLEKRHGFINLVTF